jgi:hypothetical protein
MMSAGPKAPPNQVVREECKSSREISGSGVEIVLDFARKRGVELRFLAFWDFAFE